MTTTVGSSAAQILRAFLSEHDLTGRWRVTLRTVQRRVATAALEPVGLVNRAPHFYREAVESAERIHGWRAYASPRHETRAWRPFRVCIAHRKGGVAKTTTTYYLGRELVLLGKRVILRDLDPQRTLSEALRALGTPVDEFLNPERRVILDCIDALLPFLSDDQLLILRSTLYPGTTESISAHLKRRKRDLNVAFCPERIVQGYGIEELNRMPQIVSGTTAASTMPPGDRFRRRRVRARSG